VVVLPNCLADHFGSLVPGIEKALNVSYDFHSLFFGQKLSAPKKLLVKHF
jgi:hypothetical protein